MQIPSPRLARTAIKHRRERAVRTHHRPHIESMLFRSSQQCFNLRCLRGVRGIKTYSARVPELVSISAAARTDKHKTYGAGDAAENRDRRNHRDLSVNTQR